MSHELLRDKCLKAMGDTVPISFRDQWFEFCQNRGTEIWLNYNWIRHPKFYQWVIEEDTVDWHEGAQGITVWVAKFGRVGHDLEGPDPRASRHLEGVSGKH